MSDNSKNNLGRIIKQQRVIRGLTLLELGAKSGVSTSHLGRTERGALPSARILRKIAKPLGFEESELFTLANYLSPQSPTTSEETEDNIGALDPYVASVLSQEPIEVQRTVIGIISILKSIAKVVR